MLQQRQLKQQNQATLAALQQNAVANQQQLTALQQNVTQLQVGSKNFVCATMLVSNIFWLKFLVGFARLSKYGRTDTDSEYRAAVLNFTDYSPTAAANVSRIFRVVQFLSCPRQLKQAVPPCTVLYRTAATGADHPGPADHPAQPTAPTAAAARPADPAAETAAAAANQTVPAAGAVPEELHDNDW